MGKQDGMSTTGWGFGMGEAGGATGPQKPHRTFPWKFQAGNTFPVPGDHQECSTKPGYTFPVPGDHQECPTQLG